MPTADNDDTTTRRVKETSVVDVADNAGPIDRLNNVLLAMTGRVDDDAINSARELLGTGQLDAAAELLVGCLLAGRIPVTPPEQYALRTVLEQARSQRALVDRLTVTEVSPDEQHRFSEPDVIDGELAAALRPVTQRLSGLRALWCATRSTPAGVTYGAVPRQVLLAEVASDKAVPATGYQLLAALRRAGISCSVDVFSTGTDLPDYHRTALKSANQVRIDTRGSTRGGSNRARSPRQSARGEAAGGSASDLAGEPAPRIPPADPPAASPPPANRAQGPAAPPAPGQHQASQPPSTGPAQSGPAPASGSPTHAAELPGNEPPHEGPPTTVLPAISDSAVEPTPAQAAGFGMADTPAAATATVERDQQAAESTDGNGSNVPAAVDAKLTDRERNLLRKLHEELAQREQDREGQHQGAAHAAAAHPESGVGAQDELGHEQREQQFSAPGTGGFPSIGAARVSGHQPGHGR